jgi:hypothetical protein
VQRGDLQRGQVVTLAEHVHAHHHTTGAVLQGLVRRFAVGDQHLLVQRHRSEVRGLRLVQDQQLLGPGDVVRPGHQDVVVPCREVLAQAGDGEVGQQDVGAFDGYDGPVVDGGEVAVPLCFAQREPVDRATGNGLAVLAERRGREQQHLPIRESVDEALPRPCGGMMGFVDHQVRAPLEHHVQGVLRAGVQHMWGRHDHVGQLQQTRSVLGILDPVLEAGDTRSHRRRSGDALLLEDAQRLELARHLLAKCRSGHQHQQPLRALGQHHRQHRLGLARPGRHHHHTWFGHPGGPVADHRVQGAYLGTSQAALLACFSEVEGAAERGGDQFWCRQLVPA